MTTCSQCSLPVFGIFHDTFATLQTFAIFATGPQAIKAVNTVNPNYKGSYTSESYEHKYQFTVSVSHKKDLTIIIFIG